MHVHSQRTRARRVYCLEKFAHVPEHATSVAYVTYLCPSFHEGSEHEMQATRTLAAEIQTHTLDFQNAMIHRIWARTPVFEIGQVGHMRLCFQVVLHGC